MHGKTKHLASSCSGAVDSSGLGDEMAMRLQVPGGASPDPRVGMPGANGTLPAPTLA